MLSPGTKTNAALLAASMARIQPYPSPMLRGLWITPTHGVARRQLVRDLDGAVRAAVVDDDDLVLLDRR